MYYALWWIRAGDTPTVEEAKARLEHLRRNGESADAFSFARAFPSPDETAEPNTGLADPCPAN